MKKITLLITLFVGLQWAAFSQGCLPDGIIFTTQTEIDNFQTNHPNCSEIEGDVNIEGDNIVNLNGLASLTAVGGSLALSGTSSLVSLSGLNNITSINGNLQIANTALTGLSELSQLNTVGGNLEIGDNSEITSLIGLEGISTLNENLAVIGNTLLPNLEGLEQLTTVGNYLWVSGNGSLQSLSGLQSITSAGYLYVFDNPNLSAINLNALATVSLDVWLMQNDELTNLNDLSNLLSIGGRLEISNHNTLANLTGLASLIDLDGSLTIEGNMVLNSLSGLDNITPYHLNRITIASNPVLSTCEVQSLCTYIGLPGANVTISNNATGCNSKAELEAACQLANLAEVRFSNYYSLYPIPVHNFLTIKPLNQASIDQVIIYNQLGQKEIDYQPENNEIDVSMLTPGLYVIEIQNGEVKLRDKLLVK